jgi:hypothetical protein
MLKHYAEAVGTLVAHQLTEYSTQNLGEMEEMEQQLVLIQNLCYCSVFHYSDAIFLHNKHFDNFTGVMRIRVER